ncbi:dynein light chain Tctex-type-like [Ischnura elegans]|uniref:dynein light chain Tctex-type-like n=1 Tax=Ischnura elegans TaxID=197161 RepID=UPI001ED89695|nr:dynein light chain Tctex-type-like [Ischnura elegans]XP_046403637.1 dynein light chain Tctex-type-like [Ischnura elegans]
MSFIIEEDDTRKGPPWAEDETIQSIIKESIEYVLKEKDYEKEKVKSWAHDIGERCLQGIAALEKPFKFIVEVSIMQRNGAGFHSSTACYWEATQDGISSLRWDNETMHCILNVVGLSI